LQFSRLPWSLLLEPYEQKLIELQEDVADTEEITDSKASDVAEEQALEAHNQITPEVKTGTSAIEGMQAAIVDVAFEIELATSEIEDLAASMMSVADGKKLTVLVQADNDQSDDEAAFGARCSSDRGQRKLDKEQRWYSRHLAGSALHCD